MRLKLEEPKKLGKAIEIVSELVTEVRIKLSDFGLSITAMDPANVAMISFKIPKSAFSEFEAGEEVLGVNLDDLKKILKRAGTKSTLILEKTQDSNKLEINIQDRIKRNFTLMLIEIDSEDKEMPQLEFAASVELKSEDLIESIEDASVVADACSFQVSENNFIIESKGMNSARSEFSGDEAQIEAENCKSRYSLEYLEKFMKAAKITDKTRIKFANDHPLKLEFRTEHLVLDFILAPRIETEE